jgi:DNA-binding response OmpR family regulator
MHLGEQYKPAVNGRIILIEDDRSLSDWIKDYLVSKNFEVQQCFRGDEALEHVSRWPSDLLILDGMLPGLDGLEVCKQVRPHYKGRILMLTARDTDADEISGLENGADDYLSKPIRAQVLLARINTQLRHLSTSNSEESSADAKSLRVGNLHLNKASRTVLHKGEPIVMTTKEFDVLWLLVKEAGNTVSRDELTMALRGFEYNGFDRSVDLTVSRIRRKLEDTSSTQQKIVTVRGRGYILAKEAWQ